MKSPFPEEHMGQEEAIPAASTPQGFCVSSGRWQGEGTHTQSRRLRDPVDCGPPGSSGMGSPRRGYWHSADSSFSRGSSRARDQAWLSYLSCAGSRVLYCQRHLGRPTNRVGVANQLPQPPQSSENALQDKIRLPNTSHITMCVCPKSLNGTEQ